MTSTAPAGEIATQPAGARCDWTAADLLPSYRHSLKITRGLLTKARLRAVFDRRYRPDPPKLREMEGGLEDAIWYITTGHPPWWWGQRGGGLAQEVGGGIGGRRLA